MAANPTPISGTSGNDTLNGTALDDFITAKEKNDSLNGGAGADQLFGEGGDDTLNGGSDSVADTLTGGSGNDTYRLGSNLDVVIESSSAAGGIDTAIITVSLSMPSSVENMILDSGAGAITGIGNQLRNTITGNISANLLSGGTGNDTLIGNGGADSLLGDNGDDNLLGGSGNDSLRGGAGDDSYLIDATSSTDTVNDSGGANDRIVLTPQFAGVTIKTSDMRFARSGDNLVITNAIVQGFRINVLNHFTTSAVEHVLVGNTEVPISVGAVRAATQIGTGATGETVGLMRGQAQSLVQAMAAFTQPSAASTTVVQSASTGTIQLAAPVV